jgi:hypothetical protein
MLFVPQEIYMPEKVLGVNSRWVTIYRCCVFCYGVYNLGNALSSEKLALTLMFFIGGYFQIRASLYYIPTYLPLSSAKVDSFVYSLNLRLMEINKKEP